MASSDGVSANPQRGPFIGRPMPRFEDLRLLRGGGGYTDDVLGAEQASAAFVGAPPAHASIVAIDTSAARAHPGVLAVLTGDDYVADGHLGMAHFPNPADDHDIKIATVVPIPEANTVDQL